MRTIILIVLIASALVGCKDYSPASPKEYEHAKVWCTQLAGELQQVRRVNGPNIDAVEARCDEGIVVIVDSKLVR